MGECLPVATLTGGYGEFGVIFCLGQKKGGYPNGVVTPHASCLGTLIIILKKVLAKFFKNYD
jgi:hypothetical protein